MPKQKSQKSGAKDGKERNMQLTDFAGLRELVIAHKTLLRARAEGNDTDEQGDDQALSIYFAG